MQTQVYERWGKVEWGKTQQYKVQTQAQEVVKFSDVNVWNRKLTEQPPRWSQTDFKLPCSDRKEELKLWEVFWAFKLLSKGRMTSLEMLSKGYQSCEKVSK